MRPGEKLPPFQLGDQHGDQRAFEDIAGPGGLVLYAYPKDNTSG